MAKVLSTSKGIGMTTKNNTPPKGKPNIGPGSTTGSRGGVVKPTGAKTAPMTAFTSSTMSNKASSSRTSKSVSGGRTGSLPKASGAMPKFGGK